jgi:hypothetical protein
VFRNDLQQEVARAGIVGLKADWTIGCETAEHSCSFELDRLQIDNQLQDAAHPVILLIAPSAPASGCDAPAMRMSFLATTDFSHIHRCHWQLQPLTLNADWVFASQALLHNTSSPTPTKCHCEFNCFNHLSVLYLDLILCRTVPFILPWIGPLLSCCFDCEQRKSEQQYIEWYFNSLRAAESHTGH